MQTHSADAFHRHLRAYSEMGACLIHLVDKLTTGHGGRDREIVGELYKYYTVTWQRSDGKRSHNAYSVLIIPYPVVSIWFVAFRQIITFIFRFISAGSLHRQYTPRYSQACIMVVLAWRHPWEWEIADVWGRDKKFIMFARSCQLPTTATTKLIHDHNQHSGTLVSLRRVFATRQPLCFYPLLHRGIVSVTLADGKWS